MAGGAAISKNTQSMASPSATLNLELITYEHARGYLLETGAGYWAKNQKLIEMLPVSRSSNSTENVFVSIPLPDWAADLGVNAPASLLVDTSCIIDGDEPEWKRCDWWRAAICHLMGSKERGHENQYGSAHSSASKLAPSVGLYDHAWVNRIFMFLRRWAARIAREPEDTMFGPAPMPKLYLEHDVDYLTKTIPHRLKRLVVDFKSTVAGGTWLSATDILGRCKKSVLMAVLPANYDCLEEMAQLEERFNVRSRFYLYAGLATKTKRSWLIDPGYKLSDNLIQKLQRLVSSGWKLGLHPGFYTWNDIDALRIEKKALEERLNLEITHCRQHWLKFSWGDTWNAQSAAGLKVDATLGFNDRAGFRNGAALRFRPLFSQGDIDSKFNAVPMIAMDSHFFDAKQTTQAAREAMLSRYLDELRFVGGEAVIVWHQRSLHPDYGWGGLYEYLLENAAEMIAMPE